MLVISYLILLVSAILIVYGHIKNRLALFLTGFCLPIIYTGLIVFILLVK